MNSIQQRRNSEITATEKEKEPNIFNEETQLLLSSRARHPVYPNLWYYYYKPFNDSILRI